MLDVSSRIRKISTRQAAELAGVAAVSFRSAVHRHRVATGQDLRLPQEHWPDRRTPMYDEKVIKKWIAGRPGSGRRR